MPSASWSNGTLSKPACQKVRFTKPQNDRLCREAKRRGKSIQEFLHDAAMKAIEDSELKHRIADDEKRKADNDRPTRTSTGLGIRDRLVAEREREMKQTPNESPQQIVISTAPTAPSTDDLIARLAANVTKGPNWGQSDRYRSAVAAIDALTQDSDEQSQLKQLLNEKIEALKVSPAVKIELPDLIDRAVSSVKGIFK